MVINVESCIKKWIKKKRNKRSVNNIKKINVNMVINVESFIKILLIKKIKIIIDLSYNHFIGNNRFLNKTQKERFFLLFIYNLNLYNYLIFINNITIYYD